MTKYRQYEESPGFPKTALLSFVRTSGNSVPCRGREGGQIYNAGGKDENYPLTKITVKPTEKKPVTGTSRTGNTANCINPGDLLRKFQSERCQVRPVQSLGLRRSWRMQGSGPRGCPGPRAGVAPRPLPSQAGPGRSRCAGEGSWGKRGDAGSHTEARLWGRTATGLPLPPGPPTEPRGDRPQGRTARGRGPRHSHEREQGRVAGLGLQDETG